MKFMSPLLTPGVWSRGYMEVKHRTVPHQVKVYNRNGQLVYSKRNYQNDWGGTYQGTEELLPGIVLLSSRSTKTGKVKKDGCTNLLN